MKKKREIQTLEEAVIALQKQSVNGEITLGKILENFSKKSGALFILLLSLPFCQPIQIPGFSTPFGLLIAFLGLRMAFGKGIWFPKSLLNKKISQETFQKITDKAIVFIKKIQPWIHPRLVNLTEPSFMKVINGIVICLLGLFLALPLPIPLSNLTAAWAIFFISFGILESDGLLVLIGYIIFFVTALFLYGIERGIKYLFFK